MHIFRLIFLILFLIIIYMTEKKLLDRVVEKVGVKGYSYRMEKSYLGWIWLFFSYL